ncbi:MAG: phospho-N-acetylmuramoyl-pentapeptide-transferase [Phycisphaeraceae bacterium]
MVVFLLNLLRDWLESLGLYRFLQVFQWPEFRTLCALIFSFFFVVLMGKRTIRWLMRMKIGDNPEFYNADLNKLMKQKSATPTMGGILIAGAIGLSMFLLADITNFYIHMAMICLVWLAALGLVDDYLKLTSARRALGSREGLKTWEKLVFQVGIALVLGLFIHYFGMNNTQTHILNLPGQRTLEPGTSDLAESVIVLGPWMFGIVAILVITGTSNAVNLTDGMDGLASGIMAIVAFAFIILTLISGMERWATFLLIPMIPGSAELAVVAGAMVGSCLGFLWWNCHPAKVFMGDTGSLPLGGLIGYIAVVIRAEFLLVIIGGVLVMEAVSVILQVSYFKATGGSRLFRCTPIHHHFHLIGWTEQQVVVRFWLITALLAAIGLATLKLR